MIWKISRYWNRLAYKIADLAYAMIWDSAGKSADILGDNFYSETTREILTNKVK